MFFRDEYEFEAADGTMLSVEVLGESSGDTVDITSVYVFDQFGDELDNDSDQYRDAYNHAMSKTFESEVDARDFDYYREADEFLKE